MEKVHISVAIITKDEEENIRQCLESVSFAAQIIIVDSGSTDATLSIAGEFGCEIYSEEWRGFGPQKQLAIEKCVYPWILVLDADEWVTPKLRKEIIKAIDNPGQEVLLKCRDYRVIAVNIFITADGGRTMLPVSAAGIRPVLVRKSFMRA